MSKLFDPIKIRGEEIKNRSWVSPMCQYSCEDGYANNWHMVHLGSRAVGGAGLVMSEAAAVEPEGRISPWPQGCLLLKLSNYPLGMIPSSIKDFS